MSNAALSQSFNVDDIRRIRNDASARYEGMTFNEIAREITIGAQASRTQMEEIKKRRAKRQATVSS